MFFRKQKIQVDKELYRRLAEAVRRRGYSSTDELVRHVLEREVMDVQEELDQAQAEQQLRGLGYIE